MVIIDVSGVFGTVSETSSRQCGDLLICSRYCKSRSLAFAMSATVSVHAQKLGGDTTHPMGLVNGIPIIAGSLSLEGKRTAGGITWC